KLNVTAIYACTAKFTWKVIDGEETEAVKDYLYGNKDHDDKGGKLKIKLVDDVPVYFVYTDKYNVYKSPLKPAKENPNAMEGKSKQDTIGRVNTYNIWVSKKGDMRLEVIEPKYDSEYKHTQFACDMVDAE